MMAHASTQGYASRTELSNRHSRTGLGRRKRRLLEFERFESRLLLAAIPEASLTLPTSALIGTELNFSVGFQNVSSTTAGYAPYIDLYLPTTGDEGANPAVPDGISFTSATYLGSPVTSSILTFDGAGHATHPYAVDSSGSPLVLNGTPGNQVVVFQLPFGSFTPGQPTAEITVNALLSNKADVGYAQSIKAEAGFALGNTPVSDPTTDPSIVGAQTSATVTGELYIIKDVYNGPEDETATGPNFPRQNQIQVAIAPGQTITNLDVTDLLPSNMQFVSVIETSVRGTSKTTTSQSTPSLSTPGGTLTRQFASVTGTGAANDVTMTFRYYIPLIDASNNAVINANSGSAVTSIDSAIAQGTWTPINPNDATGIASSGPASHILNDRSIATQKTVSVVGGGPVVPGATLEYTVAFQVSDYFAFQNLSLSDLISDGQHLDPTFTPTLQVNGGTFTLPTTGFNTANYSVVGNYTGAAPTPPDPDGTTTATFQISSEMQTRGQNGQLLGGLVPAGGGALLNAPGNGPVTGVITFRTVILNAFVNTYPSGEPKVNQGDVLSDNVTIQGSVLNDATLQPTGSTVTDTSAATVTIAQGNLTKSIYAVNGNTGFTSPPKIAAGDTVTYRLTYTLPLASEEQLSLSDYLPLPIFDATTVGSFDGAFSNAAPRSGHWSLGPADTFGSLSGLDPALTSNGTGNSLTFKYASYKDPANGSATIDLLFTVTASDAPFADGLFLTNQAHLDEGTTNGTPISQDAIVQIKMTEPVLSITKAAVATNEPNATYIGSRGPVTFSAPGTAGYRGSDVVNSDGLGATPLNSSVSGVQAGDLVTFAVLLQNTGTGLHGAFNVKINDTLPAGFQIPTGGLNLYVSDGAGNVIGYTDLGGGFFGSGIELNDNGSTGALKAYDPTSGSNLVLITYDLQLNATVPPSQSYTNTADLFNYASKAGGPDVLTSPLYASTVASTPDVQVTKQLVSSNQGFTSGKNLAIGEIGTYDVILTFPEGVARNASFLDSLPSGMALVGLSSISWSNSLSPSNGSFGTIFTNPTIGSNGSSFTLNFGDITNSNTTLGGSDTIIIEYTAVVLNVASNTEGTSLKNTATLSFTGGSSSGSDTVTVVVPKLTVTKSVDNPNAQANDTVTFTVTIANNAANGSGANTYDVSLSDLIPSDLNYVPGSLAHSTGVFPDSLAVNGGTISASYSTLPLGFSTTFTYQAKLLTSVAALTPVVNTANVGYTTLPGIVNTRISAYNSNSIERTGNTSDPGGSANNLVASGSATVTPPVGITKSIVSTTQSFTSGQNVAIGEGVRYRVSVTIPQGTTPNVSISDLLPAGLAFAGVASFSFSPSLSSSLAGGLTTALGSPSLASNVVSWNLGTITDTDSDSSTAETITIDYDTFVLNVASNQNGSSLQNTATFTSGSSSQSVSAPALNVVVPNLSISENVSSSHADIAGSPVTFSINVSNGGNSSSDAYDVSLSDVVPSGFTIVSGSLQSSGTAPTSVLVLNGNTISAVYDGIPLGTSSTITFEAYLNSSVSLGQSLADATTLAYSTLYGNVVSPQTGNSPVSTERTGNTSDPGGVVNNLIASASASVTATSDTITGTVYVDTNNNGSLDGGEQGISGVTVTLAGLSILATTISQTTTTDQTGQYSFTNRLPGIYTVTETQPAGYLDGKDTAGAPGGSNPSKNVFGVSLPATGSSTTASGFLFGELQPSSLSGTVYLDTNDNGVINGIDTAIANVSVKLTGVDDIGGLINTVTSTAADGTYSFTNLRPGTYTITETQPAGYLDGIDTIGSQGGTSGSQNQFSSIVITSGTNGISNNFGELLPSSLAGYVYLDSNNDGVKNNVEPGIGNVTVTLTGTDDLGGNINKATTTANDGSYSFSGLRPGNYSLVETQPSAYSQGIDTLGTIGGTASSQDQFTSLVVTSGTSAAGYLFGERGTTIAGTVFVDANADGSLNNSEAGLAGVTVTLKDGGGNTITSTTTAADGTYSFVNLPAGSYSIIETQPTGYGTSTATTLPVTLPLPGLTGENFGLTTSSLAGTVYVDANNNGTRDAAETGISGVTVKLTGVDANDNPVTKTTTTASDGSYIFTGLLSGTYVATETQPSQYNQGTNAVGTFGGLVNGDVISAIALPAGKDATSYLFGEQGATIAGTVFVDANANGILDSSEAGLAGVTVTLKDGDGNIVGATTTASDGTYTFTNLPAGPYSIVETQPIGYGTSTVTTLPVTLPLAGLTGENFGVNTASITGSVYVDANNNGTRDVGENGISGVTVNLVGTDANQASVNLTTTTSPDGIYSFTGLLSGSYTVTETQPAQYSQGINAVGTAGGSIIGDVTSAVALPAGNASTGYLFGERGATISGTVFLDANANGTLDNSEAGLPGVTVTLKDGDGNIIGTVTTASDGTYSFMNLPAGPYSIVETQPNGYGTSTAITLPFTLPLAGLTGENFGVTTSSIAGSVYVDTNNNGTRDASENGISGVIVKLTGTDAKNAPVSLTATTASDGSYSFTGLLSGTYTVTESQPSQYSQGINAVGTAGGAISFDVTSAVALPAGNNSTGYLFGERGASITGTVYVNSTTGQETIPNAVLTLKTPDGQVIGTTTSGPDGTYSFTNLPSGSYTVTVSYPPGYGSTLPTTLPVSVQPGAVEAVSFQRGTGSISGVVYSDQNNDGVREPGEAGVGGVQLTLTGTDTNGNPVNQSTTTASDGSYSFVGLLGGTYTVKESRPATYLDGKVTAGSNGGTVVQNGIASLTLTAGSVATGNNFGVLAPASIGGTVYYDYNRNNTLDSTDFGIAQVPVFLRGTNDKGNMISLSTVTDANGKYEFNGLRPGNYFLTESAPRLFKPGASTPGTAGGLAESRMVSNITLTPGTSATGYNFAEEQRPGCALADIAFHVGRAFNRELQQYQRNPAPFSARAPQLAKFLSSGTVPRGLNTYPTGTVSYRWIPTLGTKAVPRMPWVGHVKVVKGRISPA